VISVQTIVLSFESIQSEGNHNWLKSLSFFFGQTLSELVVVASSAKPFTRGFSGLWKPISGPLAGLMSGQFCRQKYFLVNGI